MNDEFLYQQIADSLRQEIQSGKLKPGDRILSVREMTRQWNCTPGTVQRAYQELSRQGLVTSRPGQGTRVSESVTAGKHGALEKAALVNRVEKSLLEFITAGYSPVDLEFAFQTALERWKAIEQQPASMSDNAIIFYGSHDPAVNWLSNQFSIKHPTYSLITNYIGSLGGLIALAQGKATLTGCHLWDPDTGDYNIPYLRKLMPGQLIIPFVNSSGLVQSKILSLQLSGEIYKIADLLKNWRLEITGYTSFERCVITAGGVSLDEIIPKTMASRLLPNLFFAGEVVDLDGDTGGYNLQIAFSTGYLAGKSASYFVKKSKMVI